MKKIIVKVIGFLLKKNELADRVPSELEEWCSDCGGYGYEDFNKCLKCKGSGIVERTLL